MYLSLSPCLLQQLRQQKHRSFSTSSSSADGDGGKKQNKHKKETLPASGK